ncbi:hypothetical protein EDC04DRAFT_2644987 [Pisolithus marmoratus]|nr:hypothetical protein EDC04DRAFT_2644987 [Pisolithus marmoratus]
MNPHVDEMRYWRNLAMWQGHERVNPDYINNAIRDIYENDLRRSDRDLYQSRRSHTPHPLHAYTPYIPRAHTSHGPRGNEARPHAQTPTRAPFLRPVVLPEEGVTPVIPFRTNPDHPPNPYSTSTGYPSGILFHPLLQPPYRRPQPPYQQQPHSPHTPAYHQTTEFDAAHPSNNPHPSSHPPFHESIRTNPGMCV